MNTTAILLLTTFLAADPRVRFLGKSTQNISANDLMWEFFKKHPMK